MTALKPSDEKFGKGKGKGKGGGGGGGEDGEGTPGFDVPAQDLVQQNCSCLVPLPIGFKDGGARDFENRRVALVAVAWPLSALAAVRAPALSPSNLRGNHHTTYHPLALAFRSVSPHCTLRTGARPPHRLRPIAADGTCLFGDMRPGKLLAVIAACRRIGITHIIEEGRYGGLSTLVYALHGFKVTSVEMLPIDFVAQSLKRMGPYVTFARTVTLPLDGLSRTLTFYLALLASCSPPDLALPCLACLTILWDRARTVPPSLPSALLAAFAISIPPPAHVSTAMARCCCVCDAPSRACLATCTHSTRPFKSLARGTWPRGRPCLAGRSFTS